MSTTTFSTDPALYIFTSLTAGSSHIVTATSRLETILRANRVPFKAVDLAVDQKARMLWGRRAGKDESGRVRKLPALVQEGLVLGDIVEIEDWNEYGELKQHVKIYYDEFTIPNIHNKPKDPPKPVRRVKAGTAAAKAAAAAAASSSASASASASSSTPAPASAIPAAPPLPKAEASTTAEKKDTPKKEPSVIEKATLPIRSIADEAAQKAKELRLQSLREKVHGKGGKPADTKEAPAKESETPVSKESEAPAAKESEVPATKDSETPAVDKPEVPVTKEPETPAAKPPATPTKTESTVKAEATTPAKADKGKAAVSPLPASTARTIAGTTVQSPTSGTWPTAASSSDALPSLETVQSPTTARWKSTESIEPPVTLHRGSMVAAASEAEIKAVEKASAIQEEEEEDSSEEESSEEESSEEDDGEEDDDDDDDEEEDDEDEDEDDDDDDDDDDSDDSDEEEEKKPAPKAAPTPAATPAEALTTAPASAPAPAPAATEAPAAQK